MHTSSFAAVALALTIAVVAPTGKPARTAELDGSAPAAGADCTVKKVRTTGADGRVTVVLKRVCR